MNNVRLRSLPFALAGLTLSFIAFPANAQTRERLIDSPYKIQINRIFSWNNRGASADAPDCKDWQEAFVSFQEMRTNGKNLTVLNKWPDPTQFLAYAYYGNIESTSVANLDAVVIEPNENGNYRIYTGSKEIKKFCGFDQPQIIDSKWFEAGIQHKRLSEALPEPSEIENLSSSYVGRQYDLVKSSLIQRGFTPIKIPGSIIERCAPGMEPICEAYSEARCGRTITGIGGFCAFAYSFEREKKRAMAVEATFSHLSKYFSDLEVVGLSELNLNRR